MIDWQALKKRPYLEERKRSEQQRMNDCGDRGKKKMDEGRREKKTAAQSCTASWARETRDIFKQLKPQAGRSCSWRNDGHLLCVRTKHPGSETRPLIGPGSSLSEGGLRLQTARQRMRSR